MSKKAFLSSLGIMANRHLAGLLRAGYTVTGFDPDPESEKKSLEKLRAAGIDASGFKRVGEIPSGEFDLAVFSETAKYRSGNLATFLSRAKAGRFLLEKPLSSDPAEVERIQLALRESGVKTSQVHANFARRTWPIYTKLRALCSEGKQVSVTLTGGAMGMGANGIHFLDLFEFLCPEGKSEVAYCHLSETPIASGRGKDFRDYGGTFLVKKGNHFFSVQIAAESSASAMFTVRGDHFIAWIDESDFKYRLCQRDATSQLPNYRYGSDYRVSEEGVMSLTSLDKVTERWASEPAILPTIDEALASHRVLFDVLKQGGATEPYRFT